MSTESSVTETVVRNHLQAFLQQKGITAILNDYDDHARFLSEAKVYQGKQEIRGFFMDFIGSLPAGAYDIFDLRSLRVDGNIVYITWTIGSECPSRHRYVCRRQRQDRFTNLCHVRCAGCIDLGCIPPAK